MSVSGSLLHPRGVKDLLLMEEIQRKKSKKLLCAPECLFLSTSVPTWTLRRKPEQRETACTMQDENGRFGGV